MYQTARRLEDLPRPLWIALIILSFWFWWPVGLAVLIYRLSTRRYGRAQVERNWQFPQMDRWSRGFSYAPPSGNRAFDEYRSETLRRLEDEQKEFVEYLDRLRQARDRQEFEQFMNERRNRAAPTETQPNQ